MPGELPPINNNSLRQPGLTEEEWEIVRENGINMQVETFLKGFRQRLLAGDPSAFTSIDKTGDADPFDLKARENEWNTSKERTIGLRTGDRLALLKEAGLRLTRRFVDELPQDPFKD